MTKSVMNRTTTTASSNLTTSNAMSSSGKDPKKRIWILYASQTGNSVQAARQIAEQLPLQCVNLGMGSSSSNSSSNWYGQVMSMDDFLEYEHAPWSSIVILCCSSYGVGQAPLGGHRFREFCDYIVANANDATKSRNGKGHPLLLQGLKYALLGLGDSKYTTFFDNPNQILRAMDLAGAIRIAPIGKADASNQQLETIEQWIAHLWEPLRESLKLLEERQNDSNDTISNGVSEERMLQWQSETCQICAKINPDFKLTTSSTKSTTKWNFMLYLALAMAILAALASFLLSQG